MAKKSLTIQNRNGDELYPVTVSSLVYDRFSGESVEQSLNDKLESSDIKTVNGVSLIGSGNVAIEGKSAYEVALDNGFVGTRQQWLDSLRGPQGNTGNVTVSDGVAQITIVNNLIDGGTGDALSAEMGKELSQDVEAMKYVLEMDGSNLSIVTVTLGYCTGSSSESGTYSGGGNKQEGDSVTVVASPSQGYSFAGWYSDAAGNTLVSSSASYTFTASQNTTLYAKFEEEQELPTVQSVNEIMDNGSIYGLVTSDSIFQVKTTTNSNWNTWVIQIPIGYGAIINAVNSQTSYPTSNALTYVGFRYGVSANNPILQLQNGQTAAVTKLYDQREMRVQSHWVESSAEVRWLSVSCSQTYYGTPEITLVKVSYQDEPISFTGKLGGVSGAAAYISNASTPPKLISSDSGQYAVHYVLLEAGKIGYITFNHKLPAATSASNPKSKYFRVATDLNSPQFDDDLELYCYSTVANPQTSEQNFQVHYVIPAGQVDRYVCLNVDSISSNNASGYASTIRLTKITPDTSVQTRSTPNLLRSLGLRTTNSNIVRSIRLDRIEADIANLSDAIENIGPSSGGNTDTSELENTINNVDARVLNNTQRISALESAVEDLGGDVSGGGLDSRDPYGLNLHCSATEGQMRFIKRARQLTDIKFTPAFNMRRVCGSWDGANQDDVFTSGKEYQGIPYTRIYNMYGQPYLAVGNCVSLDTFATACAKAGSWQNVFDPAATSSYIYSNVENSGTNVVGADMKSCFYGTYCSGFWAYAYDVKYCYLTYVKDTAGFTQGDVVGTLNQSNLHNSLHLGDTMINYPNNVNRTAAVSHVVIITDVWYNSDGTIYAVEVSESTTSGRYDYTQKGLPYGGVCRRVMWPVDKFLENWEQYTIYHYSDFEHIDYTPSPVIPVGNEGRWFTDKRFLPLLPKSGNHFLYKKSFLTEKSLTNVVLMPTISGTVNVVNELAGTDVNYTCTAGTNLSVVGNAVGTYSACIKGSSSTSQKCYWRVSEATITKSVSSNTITFTVVCPDDIDIPWNVSFSSNSTASQAQVMNGKVRCTNGNRIIDTVPTVSGNTRTYVFSVSRPNSTYGCAWITFKTKEFGNWVSDAITL